MILTIPRFRDTAAQGHPCSGKVRTNCKPMKQMISSVANITELLSNCNDKMINSLWKESDLYTIGGGKYENMLHALFEQYLSGCKSEILKQK